MNGKHTRDNRKPSSEAGISIVELLICTAILGIIMAGILPLFHRSAVENVTSSGTLELVNFGQSTVEDVSRHAFNSALLTLGPGDGTGKVVQEYWDSENRQWLAGPPPGSEMTRTMTIRQFGVDALADGVITDDEALGAGAPANAVHYKQVVVELEGRKQALGLAHQRLNLTLIKAN